MRVIADRERCVGAGQCVLAAPEVFDQSEADGRVIVRPGTHSGNPAIPDAVDLCPARALSLSAE